MVKRTPNARVFPTTIAKIMADPTFELGVRDVRAGRGQHHGYARWSINAQWDYERGRQWAIIAPRNLALKRAGKVTAEAIAWFRRVNQYIL